MVLELDYLEQYFEYGKKFSIERGLFGRCLVFFVKKVFVVRRGLVRMVLRVFIEPHKGGAGRWLLVMLRPGYIHKWPNMLLLLLLILSLEI